MQLIQDGWGSRLRAERKRLGLTQALLAQQAGISTVTYQQYEREDYEPKLSFFNKLNDLGFDVHLLLFGSVEKTNIVKVHPQQLEMRAFMLAQDYVAKTYEGILGDEGRFALFEHFRSQLESLSLAGEEIPLSLDAFNGAIALIQSSACSHNL